MAFPPQVPGRLVSFAEFPTYLLFVFMHLAPAAPAWGKTVRDPAPNPTGDDSAFSLCRMIDQWTS